MDETAVRIAAGRVKRGDLNGAVAILERQGRSCPTCPGDFSEWPARDCETPGFHDGATYDCDCGDVVTVAEAIENPARHRRCNEIPARGA